MKKHLKNGTLWLAICLLLLGLASNAQAPQLDKNIDPQLKNKAESWMKDDRTGFTENKGQLKDQDGKPNPAVKYLLNMQGLNVQLRATGFSYDTWVTEKVKRDANDPIAKMPALPGMDVAQLKDKQQMKFHRVDVELDGANLHAVMEEEQPLATNITVMNGKETHASIHSYKKITYKNIYPGIDLEFLAKKGTDKPVEYNFIVHPGADASLIKLQYKGADKISLNNGQLEMKLAFGTLKEKIPTSYIQQTGETLAVQYRADNKADGLFAFNVPAYDKNKTLVIDPTPQLMWLTYFGGTEQTTVYNQDQISGVRADKLGNVIVEGCTTATGLATAGAYRTAAGSIYNQGFLAKFNSLGTKTWVTYITGGGDNYTNGIDVDASNNIYVGMWTGSDNMQTNGNVHQPAIASAEADVYVIKFSPAGGYLWGTYVGGPNTEVTYGLAALPDGNVVIGGITTGGGAKLGFGTGYKKTYSSTAPGNYDGFVVKLNGTTGAGIWGTMYGGLGHDYVIGLGGDAAGNIYFTGATDISTTGIATAGAFQTTPGGNNVGIYDGTIGKLSSTGTLLWGTYYGGVTDDCGYKLKVEKSGNVVVVGRMSSTGFGTAGAYQPAYAGGGLDGFVAKFSPTGSRIWSTYYGSNTYEYLSELDLDENDNIYISGFTDGTSGIATNCSYQPTYGGGTYDCFVAKLDSSGKNRIWGTYIGGAGEDLNNGVSVGQPVAYAGNGVFYAVGTTFSGGLATGGASDGSLTGLKDGFIAKFSEGFAPNDVQVTVQTLLPTKQTACALGIPATITGNVVSIFNPASFTSPVFYQWQTADGPTGPWTNMAGEVFKDLTPLSGNTTKYYRRNILVNDGYCDKKVVSSSIVDTVLVSSNVAPVAISDGPQWFVCGGTNPVILNGSASTTAPATITSYRWYSGSNLTTAVSSTASFTTPNLTTATTYTLKVTDNNGCIDVDQVTVTPMVANAGRDTLVCGGSGGLQLGSPGAAGGAVKYTWTSVSGSAISSLSCADCAQPVAKPTVNSVFRLTVEVTRKDNTKCTTTDDVAISFVATPTNGPLIAGADVTICKKATATLGGAGTADATATYSWTPANYLSSTSIARPVFNADIARVACPLTYTVTAVKNGCTFIDQVNVSVINPAVDFENQTIPCYNTSEQLNEPNCGNATYTWTTTAPGVAPTLGNGYLKDNGATATIYNPGTVNATYFRTTTLNGVSCNSGLITLTPCGNGCPGTQIRVVGDKGCPKVFAPNTLQLYLKGVNPAEWNFDWTPHNIMDNPYAPVVSISSLAAATVDVVITNKITGLVCQTLEISINDPAWTNPSINIPDRNICPNIATGIGELASGGYTYEWSPKLGLDFSTVGNPLATLNGTTTYNVIKTDIATNCVVVDDVTINVNAIDYEAGPNRTVCNGATITLGNPPNNDYLYSWDPAGAAYTNGTSATSANPQVLFAGSSQRFIVTVTDPASGCIKKDTVDLNNTVTPGEYSGPAVGPICPNTTAQLGRSADAGASYLWTSAAGTTDLSCTTCSNPVWTAGAIAKTFSVLVTYPGCSTPVTDAVSVSVKPVPVISFIDRKICPSTPTNIGIGGTGNTATEPAGIASYSWDPATSLSCTNCAAPLANPQSTTTYVATITLTNGCTLLDTVVVTPTVTATAKPDATVCPGTGVQVGSPSTTEVTYAWTLISGTGTIVPANVAQPIITPTTTSTYRLTATGTGTKAGCTVVDDVLLTVKTLPAFTIGGNSSICTGGTATLSVTPVTPNIVYQWSPTAGVASPNSASTTINPTATGTYKLTQTDLNSGCSDYKEIVVTVLPNNIQATGGTLIVCPNTSGILPLTITPSFSQTVVWSPATYLNNPYLQNPSISPLASGNYVATVTNNATNCSDTALVTVIVPSNCNGSDYGDAPLVYDGTNPASHAIVAGLKIGTSEDSEGQPVSSALANGDDINQVANDEEGISFLPSVNTATKNVGVLVNSILNNTGATAYLVGWIDFNRDGDFDDIGERSGIVAITSATAAASQTFSFVDFNNNCVVKAGPSYLRLRLTTDITDGWSFNPKPNGARANGEVEDYAIIIPGVDFGDAPIIYPTAKALVNADLDNDGKPDAAGSVWLGDKVDYPGCAGIASNLANADDLDGMDDEDGLTANSVSAGYTVPWLVTVNSQGPVTGVQWGMWIDWNADGTFDEFKNGSVNTASPTSFVVNIKAPASFVSNYVVRMGVKTGIAFTINDYNFPIANGEWEDYVAIAILPLTLKSFEATNTDCKAKLDWVTVSESNTDRFELEQSTDGRIWHTAVILAAAGNAPLGKTYTTTLDLTERVINYLRLKMVDKDGKTTYSATKLLRCDGGLPITIAPNPVKDQLTFSGLHGNSTLRVLSNVGQVLSSTITTNTTKTITVTTLAAGIYYAEVLQDGKRVSIQKIVKE